MKNIILLFSLLTAVVSACQKNNLSEEQETKTKTILKLAADTEEQIEDLNIYAFNTRTGKNIGHCYSSEETSMELPYGNYEIFILANAGKDLGGGKTLEELKKEKFTLGSAIPMCGSETVQLTKETEITVTLTRCPAKIECNIEVDPSLKNMIIQSIQLRDVATTGFFFPKGEPADSVSNLELEYTKEEEKRALSRTYIVAENCSGSNPTIMTQRDKNRDNAPQGATYLLINALNGNHFCTYRVFLGENNTTDFNIRQNSVHIMQIVIRGEDEIDTRLESDPIEINDNMEHPEFPSASIPGDYLLTFSPMQDNDETYTAEIELQSGQSESFTVDGHKAPYILELGSLSSELNVPVSYKPAIVDSENSALKYSVTIRSGKGNVYTKPFDHIFCNTLLVYTSYPLEGYPVGGDVEPEGSFVKRTTTDNYKAVKILVPKATEKLKTVCDDGFALEGWYGGLHGIIITQNETYTHTMRTSNDTLAMKFKRDKCYIYTDIENVEVICFRKDPILISSKSAYVVDPNDMCSIRGKDLSKFIIGWYDDPILRTESHLVSREPEYTFYATENIRLYPEYK